MLPWNSGICDTVVVIQRCVRRYDRAFHSLFSHPAIKSQLNVIAKVSHLFLIPVYDSMYSSVDLNTCIWIIFSSNTFFCYSAIGFL